MHLILVVIFSEPHTRPENSCPIILIFALADDE